ncbi:MAG: type II toxin-antitoxin system HigB family toxin [Phycisphaerales bacterium]
MRIVTEKIVRDWANRRADAAASLLGWLAAVKKSRWSTIADVHRTYPHADAVHVASGNIITVFNIAGNRYRLITAIHYNTGIVFTLLFLTHGEYSKNR